MTMRNQEEESAFINPSMPRERAYSLAGSYVASISPGASYINTIEFIYPWNTSTRVTSVAAGERFDFAVNYRCQNLVANIADPFSMCIVFWTDELDVIYSLDGLTLLGRGHYFKNQATSGVPTIIDDDIARIANNYRLIMPAHNVIFHFNMFANDDNTPSVQVPDVSAWNNHR